MRRLVSRSEYARRVGVSAMAITKACRGPLKPACVRDRIDIDHEAAVAYAARHGVNLAPPDRATTSAAKTTKKRRAKPTAGRPQASNGAPAPPPIRPELPSEEAPPATAELDAFAELLAPLVQRFGTGRIFRDWLLALKDIETIREKRLDNDEREGRVIQRELVRTHVFGALEATNKRLLGDAPRTIVRELYALAKSGAAIEEAERAVRENLGSHLAPVKTTAARMLRDGS